MTERPITLLTFVLMFSPSCATRRAVTSFQVVPGRPDYPLRSPDSKDTPFPDVLGRYANFGPGWVELRPETELRVENAYFREGAPKRGLANFLRTEIARYQMLATGALEQIAVQSRLAQRPADQPPVQKLLSESQRRYQHHRLFYQVLVSKKADIRSAVLLSAASIDELDFTEHLMSEPDSICGGSSAHCTAFPEACSVSLEIEIVVNGAARTVPWSSVLADVVERHRHVELFRLYTGRLAPVEIDPADPSAFAYLSCQGTVSSGAKGGRMRLEHWLYTIPLRVRSVFRRAQVEQELDEELRLHLEQLIAQGIAAGKTPDEARIASLKAMDGIERRKEECQDR